MWFSGNGPRSSVVTLATFAVVLLGLQSSTQSQDRVPRITRINGFEAVEGEVLMKYRNEAAVAAHAQTESRADVETVEVLNTRGVRHLRSRRLRTSELLESLRTNPDVEYAEPNYVLRALATPNDPGFTSLWGLFNTGFNPIGGGGVAGSDIDGPAAWDTTTGSRASVIGVVDTGVDYNHPDLAANMWSAPATFQVTISGQTITCQAGTHGFNAITRTCDPMDDHYHGTHVAGTIGAVGNNGVGVTGVNWTASMMGLKFLNAGGSGSTSDAIAAIEFAIQAKAAFAASGGANVRILSNSWGGGGYSMSLYNAINAANASDILFVAAAGNSASNNDSSPSFPASYPAVNMVAVASSTSSDTLSGFSNYGVLSVHLAAPGSAIYSTTPNNTYSTLQGTSMATPQVSGAAGLALSMCSVNTAQLKALLLDNVDLVSAFSANTIAGGRLNVAKMIQDCPYPMVTGVALTPDVPAPQPAGTTVTWTAVASGGQGPYQYQWAVYDGTAWTVATGWQAGNTYVWTPASAGIGYQVVARVRSAWNSGAREAVGTQAFATIPTVTSVTIAPNVTAPRGLGTTVTWTATPVGGQPPYQYQWAVYDGTTWTVTTGWQTGNTYAWTPVSENANYKVLARARGSWNAGAHEAAGSQNFPIGSGLTVTSATITPSVASPRALGSTVTWTASAVGGQPPYQYQWAVNNGTGWTVTTGWQSGNTYAWTPASANSAYQVVARVRSAWNNGEREAVGTQAFSIMPVVTSASITPNVAAPQLLGATVTWTASAAGGQQPYQYQWAVYDGTGWAATTGWQSGNTYAWTPAVANGAYQVLARVRSAWNTGEKELATSRAYPIANRTVTTLSLTPNLTSPRAPNTTVTWTATAGGGEAPYQYQWAVFDGTTWAVVTGWSTTNTYVWTPTSANPSYQVLVRARSAWNSGEREMATPRAFVIQ